MDKARKEAIEQALDILESVPRDQLEEVIQDRESSSPVSYAFLDGWEITHWIRMEDAEPTIGQEFLGLQKDGSIVHYQRINDYQYIDENSHNFTLIEHVLYWMPLPSLPEGFEND